MGLSKLTDFSENQLHLYLFRKQEQEVKLKQESDIFRNALTGIPRSI